jgi:hypothetical protein
LALIAGFTALAAAGYSELAVQIVRGQENAIEDWGRIRRAFARRKALHPPATRVSPSPRSRREG